MATLLQPSNHATTVAALPELESFDHHVGLLKILPYFVEQYILQRLPRLELLNEIPSIVGIGFMVYVLFSTPRLNSLWWYLVVLVAPAAYFYDAATDPRTQEKASLVPLLIYYIVYVVANFMLSILFVIPSLIVPFFYWFVNLVLMLDVYLFYPRGARIGMLLQSALGRLSLNLNELTNLSSALSSQASRILPLLQQIPFLSLILPPSQDQRNAQAAPEQTQGRLPQQQPQTSSSFSQFEQKAPTGHLSRAEKQVKAGMKSATRLGLNLYS